MALTKTPQVIPMSQEERESLRLRLRGSLLPGITPEPVAEPADEPVAGDTGLSLSDLVTGNRKVPTPTAKREPSLRDLVDIPAKDEASLMQQHVGDTRKPREVLGSQWPAWLAAQAVRVGGGVLGAEGGAPGALISGGAEGIAQKLESADPVDANLMAIEGGIGAVPFASIVRRLKPGLSYGKQLAMNALRAGGVIEAGNMARRSYHNAEDGMPGNPLPNTPFELGVDAATTLIGGGLGAHPRFNKVAQAGEAGEQAASKDLGTIIHEGMVPGKEPILVKTKTGTKRTTTGEVPLSESKVLQSSPDVVKPGPRTGLVVSSNTRDFATDPIQYARETNARTVDTAGRLPFDVQQKIDLINTRPTKVQRELLDSNGKPITPEAVDMLAHEQRQKEAAIAEVMRKYYDRVETKPAAQLAKAEAAADKENLRNTTGNDLGKQRQQVAKAQEVANKTDMAREKAHAQAVALKEKEETIRRAQAAIDDAIASHEMEASTPTVRESTVAVPTASGKQSMSVTYRPKPPESELDGDDIGVPIGPIGRSPAPAAPTTAKPVIPKTNPKIVEQTLYPTQDAALHAAAGSGKQVKEVVGMGKGKWRVVFADEATTPTATPAAPAVPPSTPPVPPVVRSVAPIAPVPPAAPPAIPAGPAPVVKTATVTTKPQRSRVPKNEAPIVLKGEEVPVTPAPTTSAIKSVEVPEHLKGNPRAEAAVQKTNEAIEKMKTTLAKTQEPKPGQIPAAERAALTREDVAKWPTQKLKEVAAAYPKDKRLQTIISDEYIKRVTPGTEPPTAPPAGPPAKPVTPSQERPPATKPPTPPTEPPAAAPVVAKPAPKGPAPAGGAAVTPPWGAPKKAAPVADDAAAVAARQAEMDVATRAEVKNWSDRELSNAASRTNNSRMQGIIDEEIAARKAAAPTGPTKPEYLPDPNRGPKEQGGAVVVAQSKPPTAKAEAPKAPLSGDTKIGMSEIESSSSYSYSRTIQGQKVRVAYDKQTGKFYVDVNGKAVDEAFPSRAAVDDYINKNVTAQTSDPTKMHPVGATVQAYGSEGTVLTHSGTGVRVKFTTGRMAKDQGAKGYFDVDPKHIESTTVPPAKPAPKPAAPKQQIEGPDRQPTAKPVAEPEATPASTGKRVKVAENVYPSSVEWEKAQMRDAGYTDITETKVGGNGQVTLEGVPPAKTAGKLLSSEDVDISKAKTAGDVKKSLIAKLREKLANSKTTADVTEEGGSVRVGDVVVAHISKGRSGDGPTLRFTSAFQAAAGKGELPTLSEGLTRGEAITEAVQKVRSWWLKNNGADIVELKLPNGYSMKLANDPNIIKAAIQKIEKGGDDAWSGIVDKSVKAKTDIPVDYPWGKPGAKSKHSAEDVTSGAHANQTEVLGKLQILAQKAMNGAEGLEAVTIKLDNGFEMTVQPHQAKATLEMLEKAPVSIWQTKEPRGPVRIPVSHGTNFNAKTDSPAPGYTITLPKPKPKTEPPTPSGGGAKPAPKKQGLRVKAKDSPTSGSPEGGSKASAEPISSKDHLDLASKWAYWNKMSGGEKAVRTIRDTIPAAKLRALLEEHARKNGLSVDEVLHGQTPATRDATLSEVAKANTPLAQRPSVEDARAKVQADAKALLATKSPEEVAAAEARVAETKARMAETKPTDTTSALTDLSLKEKAAWDNYFDLKQSGKATPEEIRAAGKAAGEVRAELAKAVKAAAERGEPIPTYLQPKAKAPEAAAKAPAGKGVTSDELAKMSPEEQETVLKKAVEAFKSRGKRGRGLDDEAGIGVNELAQHFGLSVAGAVTGAAMTPDDPTTGALIGGLAGLGGPIGIRMAMRYVNEMPAGRTRADGEKTLGEAVKDRVSNFIQVIPDFYRASYLARLPNLPLNAWAGPYGAAVMGAMEDWIAGDPRGRKAFNYILNPKYWPQTFKDFWGKNWDEASNRVMDSMERGDIADAQALGTGTLQKAITMPARAMTAGDIGAREILMKAGYSEPEARAFTLTSEPMSATVKAIGAARKTKGGRGAVSYLMKLMLPFYRTGGNQIEQSAQRFPGLGTFLRKHWNVAPVSNAKKYAQYGTTGVIAGGAYAFGADSSPESVPVKLKFINNVFGPYGATASAFFLAGVASQKTGSVVSALPAGFQEFLQKGTPLPTLEVFTDWGKALTGLGDGEVDPPYGTVPPMLSSKVQGSLPTAMRYIAGDPEWSRPTKKERSIIAPFTNPTLKPRPKTDYERKIQKYKDERARQRKAMRELAGQ